MNETNCTIALKKANWISLALLIPESIILIGVYLIIWNLDPLGDMMNRIEAGGVGVELLLLGFILAGIILHELIHGLTWMLAAGQSVNAIKYGINWAALAPYAHSREPMEISSYRLGAAMPGILLGLVPYLLSLLTGNGWLLLFGFIFTVMATGDAIILWLTRNLVQGTFVKDHPSRAGCEVVAPGAAGPDEHSGANSG